MDGLITEPPIIGSATTVPRWGGGMVASPRNPRVNLNTENRIQTPLPPKATNSDIRTIGGTRGNSVIRTPASHGTEVHMDLSPLKERHVIPPISLTPTPTPPPKQHQPIPQPPTPKPLPTYPPPPPPAQPKAPQWVRPSLRPIPDFSDISDIERVKQWAVLEYQFNTLKKGLPDGYVLVFPDPEKETLEQAHARYNQNVENLFHLQFVNEEADKYRFYLICMWAVMEIVLLLFGVTSANGFTNMQFMMINKYDMTLTLLGEKRWEEQGGGTSSSPIYDIVSSSVLTMCMFIGLKLVTSALGEDLSLKATNFIMNKLCSRYKKEGQDGNGLVGFGDVFGLISELRTAASKPGGFSAENVLGMIGNVIGGGAEIFSA